MKQFLLSHNKKRQYFLLLCDAVILAGSIFLSYVIRVYANEANSSLALVLSRIDPWKILVVMAHLFTLYLLDQYNLNRLVNTIRSSVMVVLSVLLAGLVISSLFFFFPKYVFGRQVLLIHIIVVSVFMVSWRLLYLTFIMGRSRPLRLAVVGEGQMVSSFIEEISRMPAGGFTIQGVCVLNNTAIRSREGGPSAYTRYKSVHDLILSDDFEVLAFDSTNECYSDLESQHLLQLKYNGKAVYDLPTLYKNMTGKIPLTYINGRWLLGSERLQGRESRPYLKAKRLIDICLSIFLLIVTFPLFLCVAIAIRLESRGGVFFIQERLGFQRNTFNCVKFRTMVQNAEEKSGPVWSKDGDPRITRVGRFLRKTRLDELPQLWNVLKGDVSFVGPRPIREYFANMLAEKIPFYGLRFYVKPGVTGWAQVNHDYAGSTEGQLEKFEYELFYIQNMSFFLDLLTMFRTIHTVVKGEGK